MFARKSQFDDLVDKATSELLTSEDWNQIMIICDMVTRVENGPKDCAAAILRRINQRNAKVSCYAITLAEACVKNCGLYFHREVASAAFMNPIIKMILDRANTHFSVRERLLTFVQDCAREFAHDPSLSLVDGEYRNLMRQGVEFPNKAKQPEVSRKDVQKEEEELQLALALSISEAESKKKQPAYVAPEPKKSPPPAPKSEPSSGSSNETVVKALYDFPGADRGELGFKKGDLVIVLEKTHSGWWKGKLKQRPEATGLFPSNYVVEVPSEAQPAKKLSDDLDEHIPSESIEKLYDMLLAINPQKDNIAKNDTIQELFQQCNDIRPKILQLIIKYEKKKADLIQLNDTFTKSKSTYERLLANSLAQKQIPPANYGYAPQDPSGYAPQGAPYQPAPLSRGYAVPPQQNLPPSSAPQQNPYAPPNPHSAYAPQVAAAPLPSQIPSDRPAPQSYQHPSEQAYYAPPEPHYSGYAPPSGPSFTPNAPPSTDYAPENNYYAPSQPYDAPKDAGPVNSYSAPGYYQEPAAPSSSSSSSTSAPYSSAPSFYSSPAPSNPPPSSIPPSQEPQQGYGGYPAPSSLPPSSSPSYPPPSSVSAPTSSYPPSTAPQGQYGYQQPQQQQPYSNYPPQQAYSVPKPHEEVSLIDLS